MIWFSEDIESFPQAVKRGMLADGTTVAERYVTERAVRVSGTELTYLAEDKETGQKVYLHALLPMRWCMQDEEGRWVPYHAAAEAEFSAVKETYRARGTFLQSMKEETALEQVEAVAEDLGTIWMVTACGEESPRALETEMAAHIYTPQEAIALLAPVMDTLAGLHEEGKYHGGISGQTIVLYGETAVLTDWGACFCEENALHASIREDVRCISRLLYRMMTGEREYHAEALAALPAGVRSGLRNGVEAEDISIEQLWQQLHADKPVKRMRRCTPETNGTAGMQFPSKRFTIIFCVICCFVPALLWLALSGNDKLPDYAGSLSEGEILVPEFLYLTQEEAMEKAKSLGLQVIIAAREDNPTVPVDAVVMQSPLAGMVLREGDTIELTLSDGWENYVPNVCNMRIEDAIAALEAQGFVVAYEEVISANDAPGTVISQSVVANKKLARDSVIRLKVSLGREDLDPSQLEEVGNYVGMDFEEAKQLLSELHLYALQAETVYDPQVPEGVIISQDIAEGKKVPQGTVINMVVSLGVETARVPHLLRLDSGAARNILEGLGLKAVLTYVSDSRYVMDCVISQSIADGQLVPVGSEVWLTVSIGSGSEVISTGGVTVETTAAATTEETTETGFTETDATGTEETATADPTESAATETGTQRPEESTAAATTLTEETEPTATEAPATEAEPSTTEATAAVTETDASEN